MDKLIVTIGGLSFIVAIWWFFFGKREEEATRGTEITITVDGGYKPSNIQLPPDKSVTITLIRKDQNSCLEEIVFPDYKIKQYLPLDKPVTITLAPPHKNSTFHCGMNMFHGKIIIS